MSFARENWVHAAAFVLAASIGAIVLWGHYGIFEHDTDSPSAARDAFLMAVGITGGIGPAITLLVFGLRRRLVRSNFDNL